MPTCHGVLTDPAVLQVIARVSYLSVVLALFPRAGSSDGDGPSRADRSRGVLLNAFSVLRRGS
ncbi:MAG TPA: hypothetical protein VIU87_01975 [Mycobacterium sp.]